MRSPYCPLCGKDMKAESTFALYKEWCVTGHYSFQRNNGKYRSFIDGWNFVWDDNPTADEIALLQRRFENFLSPANISTKHIPINRQSSDHKSIKVNHIIL